MRPHSRRLRHKRRRRLSSGRRRYRAHPGSPAARRRTLSLRDGDPQRPGPPPTSHQRHREDGKRSSRRLFVTPERPRSQRDRRRPTIGSSRWRALDRGKHRRSARNAAGESPAENDAKAEQVCCRWRTADRPTPPHVGSSLALQRSTVPGKPRGRRRRQDNNAIGPCRPSGPRPRRPVPTGRSSASHAATTHVVRWSQIREQAEMIGRSRRHRAVASSPPRATALPARQAQPAACAEQRRTLSVATAEGAARRDVSDIFVANDAIADVQVRSANQIYIFGTSDGERSRHDRDAQIYSATSGRHHSARRERCRARCRTPDRGAPINAGLLTGTVAAPADIEEQTHLRPSSRQTCDQPAQTGLDEGHAPGQDRRGQPHADPTRRQPDSMDRRQEHGRVIGRAENGSSIPTAPTASTARTASSIGIRLPISSASRRRGDRPQRE